MLFKWEISIFEPFSKHQKIIQSLLGALFIFHQIMTNFAITNRSERKNFFRPDNNIAFGYIQWRNSGVARESSCHPNNFDGIKNYVFKQNDSIQG